MKCLQCNKNFNIVDKFHLHQKFCSTKCRDLNRKLNRKTNKCKDCRCKIHTVSIRCYSCAAKNKYKIGIYNDIVSTRFFGKHHTEISRNKISKALKGDKCYMFGHKAHHGKGSYYKNIWMRSSYEIAYAKYLDKGNIKWDYEPKAFDLGETTYRPDFYLPKTNEYIEIKGYWRDDAKLKFKLFKKIYNNIKIKILNKESLHKLNII